MKVLPIDNVNSKNSTFRSVKVLGSANAEVKEIIAQSALKNVEQDLLVLTKSIKVSPYDYNHAPGTRLFELKLVRKPETFWGKLCLRLGISSGEFLTNGYRSTRGVREELTDRRIAAVLSRLG